MSFYKIKLDIIVIFILLFIILISYIFYILSGGFGSGDNINYVLRSFNNNLSEILKFNLLEHPGLVSRPVSTIIMDIMHHYFKDNARLFIMSCILIWLLAILFVSLALFEFLNKNTVYIFVLLSSFPFFATTIFAEPLIIYCLCILFWSISLFLIIKFAKNKKTIFYYSGLIFLILSLLSLEYIIPLLWLTAFLPIVYEIYNNKSIKKKLLLKLFSIYVLPVIFISLLFLIFKIYIVKLYTNIDYTYATRPINVESFLQALYYFFVIFIEAPLMLFEVIPYILKFKFIIIALLITILFYVFTKHIGNKYFEQNEFKNYQINKFFILVLIFSLFSSVIIFFISFYPSSTFGYYNKMMVPSFISFSILTSLLFNHLIFSRYFFVPVVISFLWISSMIVQLDNFNKSWELRKKIVNDISIKIKNIKIDENSLLIANVPYFLKENYNNERVAFTIWGFKAHLQLVGAPSINVWPICYRILTDPMFYPGHNILNKLHTVSKDMEIYYYQFEEDKEKSSIEYLGQKNDMLKKFETIKLDKINYHPIILREKIRLNMKKFIQNSGLL